MDDINRAMALLSSRVGISSRLLQDAREWEDLPTRIAHATTAKETCEMLRSIFSDFEAAINPDEEIGLALSSFGQSYQIVVSEVLPLGYHMVLIKGFDAGNPVSLVQHLSQLSILLIPMKKADPEKPRRKIGFGEE